MVEDTSYNRPAPSSTADTTRMTNDRACDASIDALIDTLQDQIEMLRTKLEDWKAEAQREETPSHHNHGFSHPRARVSLRGQRTAREGVRRRRQGREGEEG
jgi:hypothetical protein